MDTVAESWELREKQRPSFPETQPARPQRFRQGEVPAVIASSPSRIASAVGQITTQADVTPSPVSPRREPLQTNRSNTPGAQRWTRRGVPGWQLPLATGDDLTTPRRCCQT